MAQRGACVGNNGAGKIEQRCPFRVGKLAYQYIALLHLVKFFRTVNDADFSDGGAGASADTLQHISVCVEDQKLRGIPDFLGKRMLAVAAFDFFFVTLRQRASFAGGNQFFGK